MRFISTLCAIALMTPAPGLSQMPAPGDVRVDAGSRVRIASPVFGTKKQVATVVSVTRDTLVLWQGAGTAYRSVATSDITALEVSRGTYTRKAKGALWGLLIGAGAGAAIGYATYKEPKCSDPSNDPARELGVWEFGRCGSLFGPTSKGSAAWVGAVIGAILGPIAGALWGMRHTDRWVPATVGTR